jgi:hypothetical protein
MLLNLLVHLIALKLNGIDLSLWRILFGSKNIFNFFEGLNLKEQFSFSFSDFKSIHGILLIKFDQSLLKL